MSNVDKNPDDDVGQSVQPKLETTFVIRLDVEYMKRLLYLMNKRNHFVFSDTIKDLIDTKYGDENGI